MIALLAVQASDFVPRALALLPSSRGMRVLNKLVIHHGFLRQHVSAHVVSIKGKPQSQGLLANLQRFLMKVIEWVSTGVEDVRFPFEPFAL
jgi:hypothetical protein